MSASQGHFPRLKGEPREQLYAERASEVAAQDSDGGEEASTGKANLPRAGMDPQAQTPPEVRALFATHSDLTAKFS